MICAKDFRNTLLFNSIYNYRQNSSFSAKNASTSNFTKETLYDGIEIKFEAQFWVELNKSGFHRLMAHTNGHPEWVDSISEQIQASQCLKTVIFRKLQIGQSQKRTWLKYFFLYEF